MHRLVLIAVLLPLLAPIASAAGPRDELLRVAPPDAALVLVLQDAREHVRNLRDSPFAAWLPTTAVGKKLLGSQNLKLLTQASGNIFAGLGTTPNELLQDVVGDAVAFAFSPAPPGRPKEERAILLIRPRKAEALEKLIAKLNEVQMQSGEVKRIESRMHSGAEYFARHHGADAAQFYCFRGSVFAFSTSEADIRALIDRDKTSPSVKEKVPVLVSRMAELGTVDAAGVILVNPRALDAQVDAQVASASPKSKRFLEKFRDVWSGIDSAAAYVALDKAAEVGLSVRFKVDKLPPDARRFLAGLLAPSAAESMIPGDALFGVAVHCRAPEIIDLVAGMAPVEPGKPGVKKWLEETVGPVVGRETLPLVLDALGPKMAMWATRPQKDAFMPTFVAAIELNGSGERRAKAEDAILVGAQAAFTLVRLGYNTSHSDQIALVRETDEKTGSAIHSLINEKGFPAGFSPSFAIQRGYLVLASHPEAIRRFQPPGPERGAAGHRTLARFSGIESRTYLQMHGEKLASFLHEIGAGEEPAIRGQLATISDVLELFDSGEIIARGDEHSLRIALRIRPAKPLKK
ncbi:MAG TPA: hypothetical protein VLM40_08750 [Gemmata sp.]|nr:hypothetical protein [Gemmata sp.]